VFFWKTTKPTSRFAARNVLSGDTNMNIVKIVSGAIATMLFAALLAVTLPGLFNPELGPFQAFVVAPVLMLLAAMISAGAHHVLELGEQRIHQAHQPCLNRTDGDKTFSIQSPSFGKTGPSGSKTGGVSHDPGHGQRAA